MKNVAEFNLALQEVADEWYDVLFSVDNQLYMQNVYITGQFMFFPEISGLRLKLLDKKSEKALLSSYKKV